MALNSLPPPPVQTSIQGRDGNLSIPWVQWFQAIAAKLGQVVTAAEVVGAEVSLTIPSAILDAGETDGFIFESTNDLGGPT